MKKHFLNSLWLVLPLCLMAFSCGQTKVSTAPSSDIIEKYLDEKVMDPGFGGKIFSAHHIFRSEGEKVFLWAYLQEYYKQDGKTIEGSGWSVPMVLNVSEESGVLQILSHQVPGDGDLYAADIRKLFPNELHQQVFDFPSSADMKLLENQSHQRAESLN